MNKILNNYINSINNIIFEYPYMIEYKNLINFFKDNLNIKNNNVYNNKDLLNNNFKNILPNLYEPHLKSLLNIIDNDINEFIKKNDKNIYQEQIPTSWINNLKKYNFNQNYKDINKNYNLLYKYKNTPLIKQILSYYNLYDLFSKNNNHKNMLHIINKIKDLSNLYNECDKKNTPETELKINNLLEYLQLPYEKIKYTIDENHDKEINNENNKNIDKINVEKYSKNVFLHEQQIKELGEGEHNEELNQGKNIINNQSTKEYNQIKKIPEDIDSKERIERIERIKNLEEKIKNKVEECNIKCKNKIKGGKLNYNKYRKEVFKMLIDNFNL